MAHKIVQMSRLVFHFFLIYNAPWLANELIVQQKGDEIMNIDREIELLAEKLLHNEITPEEHVKEYNRLIKLECEYNHEGWRPHENI